MARIRVTERYEHEWPSRAVTCFMPRTEPYTVRRVVAVAAVAAGKAELLEGDDEDLSASAEQEPPAESESDDNGEGA